MMLSGQSIFKVFRKFQRQQNRESSLTIGLLDNAPLEIELSEYGRLSSAGSECPSGLLNGESLKFQPIADLDLFFERFYSYYCQKGLWSIITKWVVELLSLGFTICFSGFVLLIVDWNGLRNAKCGMEAVESGKKPCDLVKEAIRDHPLTPLTVSRAIIVGYLALFTVYWIFCFLRFFAQLKDILRIRDFYYNCLQVTDNEIKTMPWATILDKVVNFQSTQHLCVVKDLSAHEVVMRLMRKENYLIGMINKGLLAFPIWLPGAGPSVKCGQDGSQQYLILTKTLEWTLNWCILQSMFDRNFCVKRDFISNPGMLKKRLMVVGLAMLLLSPFLVIFMLVYLFLRHAEQFYNHPSTASSRRWSNLARWMFREFNEVDHLFRHRINSSVVHASEYLRQFPSPMISLVAKFISFVSGGFAAILIIVAFLEESLLEGHIFGRNLLWYAAVFGTITAISRAAAKDDLLVLDPERTMSLVVQHTHYMPMSWRGKESTQMVRNEFDTLFQYTGMMLIEEMASIFFTPFLLLFVVPKKVESILKFIADFTVHVDGVGHVCSFSTFNFQIHGNCNYASPCNASKAQRSRQGKMEKSFLSFQSNHPSSEPDEEGKQFLVSLQRFKVESLRSNSCRQHRWCKDPWNSRGLRHSRDIRQTGSFWAIEEEESVHPYLLDCFYVSRRFSAPNLEGPNHINREFRDLRGGDLWLPRNLTIHEEDEDWRDDEVNLNLENGIASQLGSTNSSRAINESIFWRNDSSVLPTPTRSHWWERAEQRDAQPYASFLEPPEFGGHNHLDSCFSERNSQVNLDRHFGATISRSVFEEDDDLEFAPGNETPILHFDDIYSDPPQSPINYFS